MRRSHLPILEPCGEDWSAMTGDERRRHCASCDREVVHLSVMTVEEARQALAARQGKRVCVRYNCDADDNIVFAPRVRAVALATALAGCTAGEAVDEPRMPEVEVEWQACEEVRDVDEAPGQCEGEVPQVTEVPGGVIEIEVISVPRPVATMTALEFRTLMGIPLGRSDAPYLELYTAHEPAEPRLMVPLDSWMGAVSPDLLAGAVPRRDEE